ncbi:MAG: enoyl-CoA hydratase-related protein [Dehalococcoidia bacterium]
MPTYETLLFEERDRVALVTLNRPEKLNAWTQTMEQEFIDAVNTVADNNSLNAMVVTGAGRGFCAGADLRDFNAALEGQSPRQPAPFMLEQNSSQEVPHALMRGKPVIAAINGPCVGVGLTMTLACDVRIASTAARFSARFVKVGLSPECGSTRYLPLVAGFSNALFLALTGRIIDAEEALKRGLVERLVEPESLLDEALELANEIAGNPIEAVWMAKRLIHMNANEQDLRRVVTQENHAIRDLRARAGHREAITAFLEKREPRFNQPAE